MLNNTKKISFCIAVLGLVIFCCDTVHADNSERLFTLGMKNYERADYKKARHCFEKAVKTGLKDEKRKLVEYAVRVMDNFKQYLDGVEMGEMELRRSANDEALKASVARLHHAFANELMQDEFYLSMVEPHLKRALMLTPNDAAAHFDLGSAYYAAMRYEKAVKSYEKALAILPDNLLIYRMAGDASVALGDFDKAKKFYLDLIKANERSALKYDGSELAKVKKILGALPETYKEIDALMEEGRTGEAQTILRKRLSLNNSDYIAMTELGCIIQDKGDRKAAFDLFKTAVKTAPDYPLSHFYLGRLYFLMQKNEEAISELRLFKEKMKLLPRMDKATKKMYIDSLYYLSEVYFILKKYEDARKELEEILTIDPHEQSAHYDMGVYYYVYEHSRSRAYQSFVKAVDIDSTTHIAKSSRYAIEFIRNNPDARIAPDFSFIDRE